MQLILGLKHIELEKRFKENGLYELFFFYLIVLKFMKILDMKWFIYQKCNDTSTDNTQSNEQMQIYFIC